MSEGDLSKLFESLLTWLFVRHPNLITDPDFRDFEMAILKAIGGANEKTLEVC